MAPATFERIRRRLLEYDIFPPAMVGYLIVPGRSIAPECTIVQRLRLGAIFIESATRVVEVWDKVASSDGSRSAGFAYLTLQGHPERGVATFEVRQDSDQVYVLLTARSVPGTILTRIAKPLMRQVQRAITRRALRRLALGTT